MTTTTLKGASGPFEIHRTSKQSYQVRYEGFVLSYDRYLSDARRRAGHYHNWLTNNPSEFDLVFGKSISEAKARRTS